MHNSCISFEWKPPGDALHWIKLVTETTGTTEITNRLSINSANVSFFSITSKPGLPNAGAGLVPAHKQCSTFFLSLGHNL